MGKIEGLDGKGRWYKDYKKRGEDRRFIDGKGRWLKDYKRTREGGRWKV